MSALRQPLTLPPPASAGDSELVAPRRALASLARRVPWAICAITALAAVLRFSELDDVHPNSFYDAAVASMSMSWHNFFFGAFDPGALLSIDKPPLDLWLQVISVKLLGWNRFALALPEALGGTLSAPLLYDAVRRAVGRPAGLAAGLALAVLPESVLTSRSDTMDSVMMLFIIAALWLVVRGSISGRRAPLILAGAALGLAFNVKVLEALVAAPALVVLYTLSAPGPARRKAANVAMAGGALVFTALAWPVAVSIAPGHHPWPVGSSDGSVWNAMFVFNGLSRSSLGSASASAGGPGPFRLLISNGWHYDVLFGCVLFAAMALGVAAILSRMSRWLLARGTGRRMGAGGEGGRRKGAGGPAMPEAGVSGRIRFPSADQRMRRAFAVSLVIWIVFGLLVFDTMGTLHARYLEALAPALAAMLGYGAASLAGFGTRSPLHRVRAVPSGGGIPARSSRNGRPRERPAIVASVLALLAVYAYTLHFKQASLAWAAVALILATAGAGLLARTRGRVAYPAKWLMAGFVTACAMLFPIHESLSLIGTQSNDSVGLGTESPANISALSTYLLPRTGGVHYELAADDPTSLSPLVIFDHRAILPLTSFGGRPLVGLQRLQADVRSGAVIYGLVSDYACDGLPRHRPSCTPAALWIREHGIDVSAATGLKGAPRLYVLWPAAPASPLVPNPPFAQLSESAFAPLAPAPNFK